MSKMDAYEEKVLAAFEKGDLKSVATKSELAKFKAAARATAISVAEALRREAEVKAGTVDLVPGEEAIARVRARIS